MKIYVHDYLIDYLGFEANDKDICCGIDIYYSFEKNNDDDTGVMNLDYFSIYAGTSSGLKKYIDEFDQKASMFFFRPIMVFKSFDEKGIYHFLKNQIESLIGNSKQELILKAMKNFDWCHDNPNIHDNVSYLVNGY